MNENRWIVLEYSGERFSFVRASWAVELAAHICLRRCREWDTLWLTESIEQRQGAKAMKAYYWLFAYLGLMTVTAAFILGFKYDPFAPFSNYLYNLVLYGIFIGIHLAMTLPGVKQMIAGSSEGSSRERQIYITVTIVTWLAVLILHQPVSGFGFESPSWLAFLGLCGTLLGAFAFFEFASFETMNGFIGMPDAQMSHSEGSETPLLTEGSYSSVRHPMYRGAVIIAAASLLVHPNTAQLFWALLVGASFVLYIPIEEEQLLKARGDEYREYMEETPWRLFPEIW